MDYDFVKTYKIFCLRPDLVSLLFVICCFLLFIIVGLVSGYLVISSLDDCGDSWYGSCVSAGIAIVVFICCALVIVLVLVAKGMYERWPVLKRNWRDAKRGSMNSEELVPKVIVKD